MNIDAFGEELEEEFGSEPLLVRDGMVMLDRRTTGGQSLHSSQPPTVEEVDAFMKTHFPSAPLIATSSGIGESATQAQSMTMATGGCSEAKEHSEGG